MIRTVIAGEPGRSPLRRGHNRALKKTQVTFVYAVRLAELKTNVELAHLVHARLYRRFEYVQASRILCFKKLSILFVQLFDFELFLVYYVLQFAYFVKFALELLSV